MGLLTFSLSACSPSEQEQEKEALEFLYASMPLPDSVDYPREFWENCVRSTLQARHEMPWGKKIPEREWKHFVLPVRVNNENLDDARTVLYQEHDLNAGIHRPDQFSFEPFMLLTDIPTDFLKIFLSVNNKSSIVQ